MKTESSEWGAWKRQWGTSAVAGAVSILVHLLILGALCLLNFSRSSAEAAPLPSPNATVQRIHQLANQIRVVAKPKMQRPAVTAGPGADPVKIERLPEIEEGISAVEANLPPAVTAQSFEWPDRERLAENVEFFGSQASRRNVCYVVDCSGSMQGMFERVRKELSESIEALQPDQFFAIVFFGGGGIRQFGGGDMFRATPQARLSAETFIEAVEASGAADAISALERAAEIGAAGSEGGLVIYFLTDGFETAGTDVARAAERMNNLLDAFAPGVQVNTIGFWPRGSDRRLLEQIAEATGGTFVSLGRAGDGTPGMMDIGGHSFLEGMVNNDE